MNIKNIFMLTNLDSATTVVLTIDTQLFNPESDETINIAQAHELASV
ncbi:hypothetical protein F975_00098 [Acinetobacter sp. ANC 3789]|nr:hypothetical protein F975_00098 [Acinetobacter sp. ANC 3789]